MSLTLDPHKTSAEYPGHGERPNPQSEYVTACVSPRPPEPPELHYWRNNNHKTPSSLRDVLEVCQHVLELKRILWKILHICMTFIIHLTVCILLHCIYRNRHIHIRNILCKDPHLIRAIPFWIFPAITASTRSMVLPAAKSASSWVSWKQ